MIKRKCKYCKREFLEYKPIKIKNKESKNYCLTCWFKKYMEECREERRIALGLK